MGLNETHTGLPFMIEEFPVGVIKEVTEDNIIVDIWDKFIGVEFINETFEDSKLGAIYLSKEKQIPLEKVNKTINETWDSIFNFGKSENKNE